MPSQLSPPPLPQSAPPTPRQPTLYWPTVYVAGAWALLLVAGTTVIVWAGSRPTRLVKVSVPAETPTTAAVRPPEPVPVAAVPAEPSLLPVAEPAPLPVDEPKRRPARMRTLTARPSASSTTRRRRLDRRSGRRSSCLCCTCRETSKTSSSPETTLRRSV